MICLALKWLCYDMTLGIRIKKELDGVNKKLGPANIRRAENGLGEQVVKDMFPYVPKADTKRLSKGVWDRARKAGVYNMPYAKAQFYGGAKGRVFRKYTTSGTGKRWDLVAKKKHGKSWGKRAAREMGLK